MKKSTSNQRIDFAGKLSLSLSTAAFLVSLSTFIFQFFWHSQSLIVSVLGVQVVDGNLRTKLAFSNLGNQDEVIYDVQYGYRVSSDTTRLFKPENAQSSFVVKAGESTIFTYEEPLFGNSDELKQPGWLSPITIHIDSLSSQDFHGLDTILIDPDNSRVYFELLTIDMHDAVYKDSDLYSHDSYRNFISYTKMP